MDQKGAMSDGGMRCVEGEKRPVRRARMAIEVDGESAETGPIPTRPRWRETRGGWRRGGFDEAGGGIDKEWSLAAQDDITVPRELGLAAVCPSQAAGQSICQSVS